MPIQNVFKSIIAGCLFASMLFFTSCMNLFQAVAFPNQCKKCTVYYGSEVVFVTEGCGASNVRLEEEAKVKAYDLSRGSRLGCYEVRCETWREEPTSESGS